MTLIEERLLLISKAAMELSEAPVAGAVQGTLAVLLSRWDDQPHTLADCRADLDRTIAALTALRMGLVEDPYETNLEARMRKELGLPVKVPPFDDEVFEEWRHITEEHHPYVTAAELRQATQDFYEEHQGVMPPGPLDYTR